MKMLYLAGAVLSGVLAVAASQADQCAKVGDSGALHTTGKCQLHESQLSEITAGQTGGRTLQQGTNQHSALLGAAGEVRAGPGNRLPTPVPVQEERSGSKSAVRGGKHERVMSYGVNEGGGASKVRAAPGS